MAFGAALLPVYEEAKRREITDQAFAKSIGVERPQLGNYLAGQGMPSHRTIVMAFKSHGISVPYLDIQLEAARRPGSRKTVSSISTQLILPFRISSKTAQTVNVELRPLGPKRFDLKLTVHKLG